MGITLTRLLGRQRDSSTLPSPQEPTAGRKVSLCPTSPPAVPLPGPHTRFWPLPVPRHSGPFKAATTAPSALQRPARLSLPPGVSPCPKPSRGLLPQRQATGRQEPQTQRRAMPTLPIKGSGEASWVATLLPLPGSALKPSPRELLCRPHPLPGPPLPEAAGADSRREVAPYGHQPSAHSRGGDSAATSLPRLGKKRAASSLCQSAFWRPLLGRLGIPRLTLLVEKSPGRGPCG